VRRATLALTAVASGIADGTMDVEDLPCMKDLSFKAKKK
jgi:hypothetical protein